jgi:hypothetical protein
MLSRPRLRAPLSFPVIVAFKYEGQPHFYAFNNHSYFPSDDDLTLAWTHKDKRLDQNHVLVEVEVVAEGFTKRSGDFLIRNPTRSVTNFEIANEDAA